MSEKHSTKGRISNKNTTMKIRNILRSSRYCCVCLEESVELCSLEANHFVDDAKGYQVLSIKQILIKIFGGMASKIMTNDHICVTCKKSAINSYMFISNTKQNANIIENYIKQLDTKTNEILKNVNTTELHNVLIILGDIDEVLEIETKPRCSMRHIDNVIQKNKLNKSKLTKDITVPKKKPYKCNMCTGRYTLLKYLKLHKYRMHNIRLTKSDYSCSVCHKKFNDLKELRSHMAQHSPDAKHYCEICDQSFSSRKDYKQHTRKIEHKTKANPDIIRKNKFKNINCSVCHINFTNMTAMRAHVSKHGPNEMHSCLLCSVEFKTRKEYLNHTFTVTHQKNYDPEALKRKIRKCPYCEYSTYDKYRMERHIMHGHYDLSPFVCEICSKRLTTSAALQMHIKRHQEGSITFKEQESVCDLCGKVLHSSQAAVKHARIHSGESPYPCDVCNMAFKSASDRSLHKLRKHSERSVFCPLCKMPFFTLSNMRTHVRKVHWKSEQKFDHTKLEGLAECHYHLFKDRRMVK